MREMAEQMREHLENRIVPFWHSLRDEMNGGYFESVDFELVNCEDTERTAVFQSGVLRFFADCAGVFGSEGLTDDAEQAYGYIKEKLLTKDGRVFARVSRTGEGEGEADLRTTALTAGALASYARATGSRSVAGRAIDLMANAGEIPDDITALLDIADSLAVLFEVTGEEKIRELLGQVLERLADNADIDDMSLFDAARCGWVPDACATALSDCDASGRYEPLYEKCVSLCSEAAERVLAAMKNGLLLGDDDSVAWKTQAHGLLAMANAYLSVLDEGYLDAAYELWDGIRDNFEDNRRGGEWFRNVCADGTRPAEDIVDSEKSPMHNGLMCVRIYEWQSACEVLEHFDTDGGISFTVDPVPLGGHDHGHCHCDDDDCDDWE